MTPTGKTILLTRPLAQSQRFAKELRVALGQDLRIAISPLLEIASVNSELDLSGTPTLLFTSTNGVTAFAARTTRRDLSCICVGRRTRDAAKQVGLQAVSANGTAQDLIDFVLNLADRADRRYLHIKGRNSVGDIAKTIKQAGLKAEDVILYDQIGLNFGGKTLDLLGGPAPVILPLFSPRTAQVFARQVLDADFGHMTAICLSENVAEKINHLSFGKVIVVPTPDAKAMMHALAAII